jgi:hypothetical protein
MAAEQEIAFFPFLEPGSEVAALLDRLERSIRAWCRRGFCNQLLDFSALPRGLDRMLEQIALGAALMAVTTVVHTVCTIASLWFLRAIHAERWGVRSHSTAAFLVAAIVVMLFFAALIEAAIWAATYVQLEAISSFEEALYFSIVTFTTLGYGDITLNQDWRLLCSIEAANGIILFGWSTALVFASVRRIAGARESADEKPS